MAFAIFSLTCGSALAQTTNTVTNGGTINMGVTEVITNPVTSITAAITNNGSLQFWQSTALTDSGIISGIGTVTKATGSGNLTLSGANTFSGKVTVSSGTLTASGVSDTVGSGLGLGTQVELGGSGANLQVTVGAGATNTTSRQLILNNSATLGNGGNGSLVWNGNTVFNTNTTAPLLFNSGGTGTNVFGGIIGNTTNNSAVNLNFQATQIWSLTGSNTFSGGITIGGGKVIADKLANIGTASSIGTAGNIRFGYFASTPTTFEYVGSGSTNNIQVKLGASAGTGNNSASFLQNGTGALVLTNTTFTLTSDVATTNINRTLVLGGANAADNTITGTINDNTGGLNSNSTVSIVKADAGKWILSGANTYTGGTTISNGIFQIGAGGTTGSVLGAITNNGTLILSRSGNPTISNVISGSGAVLIASNASLTLSGASTFGGKVTAAGSSTLYAMGVADSGTSALGTNSQVELGSDPDSNKAALYVNVAAGTTNTTARALIANGKSFTLGNYSNGVLVWNGNTTFNRGTNSSFSFNLGADGKGTNVFAGVIGDTTPDNIFETTAPVNMTVTAASIWSLTGSNTFSGGVTLNDGKLVVSSLDNGASSIGTGNFRMGGFANVPVLEYVGSGSTNNRRLTLGAGSAATGGKILNNGTGALVFTNANFITGANVLTAGLNRAVIFGGTNTADNAITGVIANVNPTNTVSIVKEDAGKWILGGTNTYTGGTTVSNGVLELGQTGSLGFVIKGTGTNNQIDGTGTLSLKGKFDFDLTGAATNLNSAWTIVSNSLTTSYRSTFSVNGFSGAGGNWTKITNGVAYVFTQTNGVLSVKLPITWAVSSSLNFGYDGNAQLPLITPTGSTGALTYSFVGIDGTSYSGNSAPSAPGRYKVTASVASDGTYAPGSQDVYFTIGNFSAFRDFWWNGLVSSTVGANSPNQLEDWLNISKASVQGRSLGTPNKSNSWSYGTVNCTGGTPTDLYPTSINGFVANGRASWQQFWDATLNNNAIYANGPPLWTYRASGAEIGWYGSAWFSDAPGFDGVGADRNGLSTAANSNTRYLWLRVGGSAYDGVAPAVRWTAPADGTYRFQGEFLPGGNTVAANSTMAVSILTANNPDLPDNEPQTLLPRTVVANDGSPIPFDYVRTVVKGQTVTWLVGADGNNSGDVMGLQAEVTQVIPVTLSGVTVGNKDYDGTTTATLQGTPVLNGIAEGSSVSLANLLASFNSPEPGLQAVTITAELAGADAGYYSLSLPTDLSATINTVSTVPTFAGAYPDKNPSAINPANGLSYLMNYALGGTGPSSTPALPKLTSNGTSLTLTANIRNSGQGVDVVGQYAYDLAGQWTDVVLTPTGATTIVTDTTVQSFTQNVEAGRPKKFMRLKATKNP